MTKSRLFSFPVVSRQQARTASIDGEPYLVVPGVPVREQVMNNYLVPADEISHFAQAWNGAPITLGHPSKNHGSAGSPDPDVPIIGRFYNSKWNEANKRLEGEYWFNINKLKQSDEGKSLLNGLQAGKVLETSTGYWSDEDWQGGNFDGKSYDLIHRNLRPDHIAVLPDGIGACSVEDGCGVNRNAKGVCQNAQCPYLNQPATAMPVEIPPYEMGHLPTAMLINYAINKGNRTAEQLSGLRERIAQKGIEQPVAVTALDDGNLRIEDGNHRVQFARQLDIEQIPVTVHDERMQPVNPQVLYQRWMRRKDQAHLSQKECPCMKINKLSNISAHDMPEFTPGHLPMNMLLPYATPAPNFDKTKREAMRGDMEKNGFGKQPVKVTFRHEDGGITMPAMEDNERVAMAREFNINQIPVEVKDPNLEDVDPADVYSMYMETYGMGDNVNNRQNAKESARTPSFDGTEETSWEGVGKSVGDFAKGWVKHGGKEPEGGMPSKLADMPKEFKTWAAGKTLLGDPNADDPRDLLMFPVVNPSTNKLNAGALRAVMSGRGSQAKISASALESARNKAQSLLKSHFKTKGNAKMNLTDFIALLKGKGVKVKVNEAGEEPVIEVDETTIPQNSAAPELPFTEDQITALKELAGQGETIQNALKDLPAAVKLAKEFAAQQKTKKDALVAGLKVNKRNIFSDADLGAMSVEALEKYDASLNVSYGGYGDATLNADMGEEALPIPVAILNARIGKVDEDKKAEE